VNIAARADRSGVFAFPPVNAGGYLLTAARPGFATLRYGQKAWNAPGAPIFLEEEGTRGEYRFRGLPPGTYRLLSTFDLEDPDEQIMEAAHARQTALKEAGAESLDLDLYIK
jgi:hypothetical protein